MTARVPRLVEALRSWPPSQRWLRLVVLLGPVVALLSAAPAGNATPVWLLVPVLLLSVLFAAAPDSGAGTLAMLVVVGWWVSVPDDALHPTVLVAAAALLASHVAAVVGGAAPAQTPVEAGVARLWVLRASAVLAAAPVLWVLALVLRDGSAPAGLWPAGLLAALLAMAAAATAFPQTDAGEGARR